MKRPLQRTTSSRSRILKKSDALAEQSLKIVISASRRTDIPAFYMPWFMERLKGRTLRGRQPLQQSSRKLYLRGRTRFTASYSGPRISVRSLPGITVCGWRRWAIISFSILRLTRQCRYWSRLFLPLEKGLNSLLLFQNNLAPGPSIGVLTP